MRLDREYSGGGREEDEVPVAWQSAGQARTDGGSAASARRRRHFPLSGGGRVINSQAACLYCVLHKSAPRGTVQDVQGRVTLLVPLTLHPSVQNGEIHPDNYRMH